MQDATQRARSDGIARLYGVTASPAAFAPIEEFALPVGRLAEAVESLTALFSGHDLRLVWHGQASAGALHMRPWLPVRGDLAAAGNIAAAASARLAEFAGQLASAEGQGIARSHAMQAGRDPKLAALFEAVKLRFDPRNRLNPGKIVFPAPPDPMFWRSEPAPETAPPLAALACDGTGLCRRLEGGVMCPSFRVTRDERDSPRGRANTLRLGLGGQLGADALASDAMAEAMQLCVSCKACRSECPRGADIAAAKIAVQHARVGRNGLAKFDRSAAFLPHSAPRLRRWRHLLNLRDLLPWTAALSERLTGFSADRPWPRWTSAPFGAGARLGAAEGPGTAALRRYVQQLFRRRYAARRRRRADRQRFPAASAAAARRRAATVLRPHLSRGGTDRGSPRRGAAADRSREAVHRAGRAAGRAWNRPAC